MQYLSKGVTSVSEEMLKPIETNWQPSDFLPDSADESFYDKVKEIQQQAENLSYDLLAVLVGDTITEEALPTYQSWLFGLRGVDHLDHENPWIKWVRGWSAEENRHGDLLNRYLYLCGRIDMQKFEASTQYLIADGFDIQTGDDPYRNFVYTSFQELATNISHRRVATLAKQSDNLLLSKICGQVAADEARHAKAYKTFIGQIFEVDPNEMMQAYEDMMRKKIVMPAHYLLELGVDTPTFSNFSDAAQRIGVYTSEDYVDILKSLNEDWKITEIRGLDDKGEKARDYLLALPDRLTRIAERMRIPDTDFKFNWIKA